ncbi:hypothetical protein MKX03_027170, partial [Papaver bracteatum]
MDTIRNNSWVSLCILLFGVLICNKLHHAIAADKISLGDSLTGDETIVSSGDNFELGFFKPGTTSQNHYIGIWYKKVSVQTVVWVANRDAPILDPFSSKFTFLNANLVLLNNVSKTPIWSTNLALNTLNTPQVVLGDDGNLVLRDGSNPNVMYWQSFDYPTDTLLPGAKLGFNRKTNQIQKLISWRSPEGPSRGLYSLESGPSGTSQYAIYWNNSKEVWSSKEWDEKSKTFPSIPDMRLDHNISYSYASNVNGSYFTYSVYNNSTSRFVIDFTGRIQQLTWSGSTNNWNSVWVQPQNICDVYATCGPFGSCQQDIQKCDCMQGFSPRSPADDSLQDSIGGCVRSTPLQCGNKDGFSPIQTPDLGKLPDKSHLIPEIDSAKECRSACKVNCHCNAYSFMNRCLFWYGDIINFNNITSSLDALAVFYLKLAASEIHSPQ